MSLKFFIAIALTLAVLFMFLWIQEKRKADRNYFTPESYSTLDSIQKDRLAEFVNAEYLSNGNKLYKDDTEPVEYDTATSWTNSYKDTQYPYFNCLNEKEGIYHDLEKLLYYLKSWKARGVTRVDFRYAKYPSTWPYPGLRNQFTLILHPQKNNIDLPVVSGIKETLPLNLGDLHP